MIDWSQKELLILAFDHRSSFKGKLFEIKNRQPKYQERRQIEEYKKIVFEGFTLALERNVPKDIAGLLVDEEFGTEILREAKRRGLTFAMPVEKSGQAEFDFEYGENYRRHIKDFDPTFAKVLVRYNPAGDATLNQRQLQRLRILSDYLQQTKKAFLFELIVPATPRQLSELGGSKEAYDVVLRPRLMVESMKAIQAARIQPAVWKLEGVHNSESAKAVVEQAWKTGRKTGVITLGRGASKEQVQKWLKIGAKTPGIIGFAVGRTIFWQPLVEHRTGKLSRNETIEKIAQNYSDFSNLWLTERRRR